MPPAMSKPHLTSVRDRVAAIEKMQETNSVIRARFVPDVKGVNRYKHFHTPIEQTRALNGHLDRNGKGELPMLITPGRMVIINSNTSNGYESNGVEKIQRKNSGRRVNLPPLNGSPRTGTETTTKKDKEHFDLTENHSQPSWKSSTSSENSKHHVERNVKSGVHLNDDLTIKGKRTFAHLEARQNGVIINPSTSTTPSLEVSLPQRSKSAHNVSEQISPATTLVAGPNHRGHHTHRETKDTATQTAIPKRSTTSVEFLDSVPKASSTQTDTIPIVIVPRRKSEVKPNMAELEEREALFNVIEEALGETIDRYSRTRTNQIIANSARKQAQIWRDVKDFFAGQLVPQAIVLANKSRSKSQTTVEMAERIRVYP